MMKNEYAPKYLDSKMFAKVIEEVREDIKLNKSKTK